MVLCSATAGNDHVKLMNKLFANYRREFLPRVSLGEPVNVSFKFELINIKDVVSLDIIIINNI